MRTWAATFFLLLIASVAQAEMVSIVKDKVNMRSGPGINSDVQWELSSGYPLLVMETKGNWIKVQDFEKDAGWVHESMISKEPHLIVKAKRANIRSGPGTNFKIVGTADYGVVFQSLGRKQGWAQVKHANGVAGWVNLDLLWGW